MLDEENFIKGNITMDIDGKINGTIFNATSKTYKWGYLLIGHSINQHSVNTAMLFIPGLKPSEKYIIKSQLLETDILKTKLREKEDFFHGINTTLRRKLQNFDFLPGESCYFSGVTDDFFFAPYFDKASKPFFKRKIVFQKLPFKSLQKNYYSDSRTLKMGIVFSLPDKDLLTSQEKPEDSTTVENKQSDNDSPVFGSIRPQPGYNERLLFNSSVVAHFWTRPISNSVDYNMYLTLDFTSSKIYTNKTISDALLIEILNPKTKKWEIIARKNLREKTDKKKNLQQVLRDYRMGQKEETVTWKKSQSGFGFANMFKKQEDNAIFDTEINVKINNWEKYFHPGNPYIYFKFTHIGAGKKVIIQNPEITIQQNEKTDK